MACASTCKTQDHRTYGECLRAKNLRVGWSREMAGLDRGADRRNDEECELYHRARIEGIQPDGTTERKVHFAQDMSDRFGARYGEDFHVIPTRDKRGYQPVFKKDIAEAQATLMTGDAKAIYDAAKAIPGSGVH